MMRRHFGLARTHGAAARDSSLKWALLCGVALFGSGPAYAEAQPAGPTAVGEIVVTAQKRAENIQKVPMTVDALGTRELQTRQIQTISDLTISIPGLRTDDVAGMANISIRGVGTTFTTGSGESSVAVHIDGVYIAQPKASLMGEDDLAQVEVLRGPQGTLYGRNSTAGVINFITGSPTDVTEGGVSVRYGNYNDVRVQGYLSGPLFPGVDGRIYVTGERHDGWGRNIETGQQLLDLRSIGAHAALSWDVQPRWKMELKGSANYESFAGPLYQPFNPNSLILGLAPPLFSTLAPDDVKSFQHYASHRSLEVVSFKNDFKFSDNITLTSLTGFVHFESLYNWDGFAAVIEPPYPGVTAPQPPVSLIPRTTSTTVSQEFDLKGSTNRLKWLVGLYYFHDDQSNPSTSLFDALGSNGIGLLPFKYYTNIVVESTTRDSESAFVDGTYSLAAKFRVYGGVRVLNEGTSQDITNIHAFGIATPGDFPVTACSPSTSPPQNLNKTAVTGRGGVQYDVMTDAMAYAQYSTGYKSGGFSQSQCGNEYKPETVDAVEIGLKSQWLDRRLTLNVSAYHYAYNNLEIEQATLFGVPIVNAPKSHVWGLDASLQVRPTAHLSFDGTATFLDARYDQFYNQDGTFGVPVCANPAVPSSCPAGSSLAGIALNKAPHASGAIGGNYRWATSIGDIDLRAETYMTSSYHLREFNFPWTVQRGYVLVNLYATLRMDQDRYELRLFAKNVGNVRFITGIDGVLTGAVGSFNPPPLYGAEIAAKF
jgi:iron complex outermembrane receptor protein